MASAPRRTASERGCRARIEAAEPQPRSGRPRFPDCGEIGMDRIASNCSAKGRRTGCLSAKPPDHRGFRGMFVGSAAAAGDAALAEASHVPAEYANVRCEPSRSGCGKVATDSGIETRERPPCVERAAQLRYFLADGIGDRETRWVRRRWRLGSSLLSAIGLLLGGCMQATLEQAPTTGDEAARQANCWPTRRTTPTIRSPSRISATSSIITARKRRGPSSSIPMRAISISSRQTRRRSATA